jgi:FkbM family methyltransferase
MVVIIQVGTNNGNDHVRDFCKIVQPDVILLVEPFPIHKKSIIKNYTGISNVILEEVAIVPYPMEKTTIYFHDKDGPIGHPKHSYEVASVDPEHLVRHGYSKSELKSFTARCKTLSQLFDTYSIKKIDYLFLDIEGIDFDVLTSIDFSAYDIHNLQIEYIHLDQNKLVSFMAEKGYRIGVSLNKFDTMFVKQSS